MRIQRSLFAALVLLLSSTAVFAETVSGRVVAQEGPIAGVVMSFHQALGDTRIITTDSKGEFAFGKAEHGFFYSLSLELSGYSFVPQLQIVFVDHDITNMIILGVRTSPQLSTLDTPEFFVRQQYLDFLLREPDESGLNFWSAPLKACTTLACKVQRRREVLCAFLQSGEYQSRFGAATTTVCY